MAVLDDLSKVVNAVDKLSTDGLPIKLEHEVATTTIWQFVGGLAGVIVLMVLLLGVKDVIVKRIT